MASVDAGGSWTTEEDVCLCEAWLHVCHDPVSGNEMRSPQMWKKILDEFNSHREKNRTEQSLSSRWKILNKDLGKWRSAVSQAKNNVHSGTNLSDEGIQAQSYYIGNGKKPFTNFACWEVVKNCPKFRIVPNGPPVVLNETPLFDSPTTDSSMESPINLDSPVQRHPVRPPGRKAAKKGKGIAPNNDLDKYFEQIAVQGAVRLEQEKERLEAEKLRFEANERDKEYERKIAQDKIDRETMSMDTTNMSPATKEYWKDERREVMRRKRLFQDGPSNTDWFDGRN